MRAYFLKREEQGTLDAIDDWLRMVCVNRLTGPLQRLLLGLHAAAQPGDVRPMASARSTRSASRCRPSADVWAILKKKSKTLLADVLPLMGQQQEHAKAARLMTGVASVDAPRLEDRSVQLVVTSPPFLDVVQYASDNWLRCWFCGIEAKDVPITMARSVEAWQEAMREAFVELYRVVKPGGHVAFEVG